ncbi:MAG: hypothetical protein U0903_22665, partial [Planctomycetales bacterium]
RVADRLRCPVRRSEEGGNAVLNCGKRSYGQKKKPGVCCDTGLLMLAGGQRPMSRAQGIRKLLFLQLVIAPVTKSGRGTEIGILKRRAQQERRREAGVVDGFAHGVSQDLGFLS